MVNDIHGGQVAYNVHPLYTFAGDRPGQVTGQGVQGFAVVTPGMAPIAPLGRRQVRFRPPRPAVVTAATEVDPGDDAR